MNAGSSGSADSGSCEAFSESLDQARQGDPEPIGALLERCRPYLLAIAQAELTSDLAGKLGASDLVQDTMARGVQHFGAFQGHTSEELAGWLRRILLNHLANVRKAYQTDKRQVQLEQPADSGIADPLQEPPSRAAISLEESHRLEAALARLPPDYQQVIQLRHRENLSFAEIGNTLQKSEDAAGKLWSRAIRQLQAELQRESAANSSMS